MKKVPNILLHAARWKALAAEAGFLDEMRERLLAKLAEDPPLEGQDVCMLNTYYNDLVQVMERLITLDKAALRHAGLSAEQRQSARAALHEHQTLLAQQRTLAVRVLSPQPLFSKS